MALIICSECGKEFSDKAISCPGCGCPTRDVVKSIERYRLTNAPIVKESNSNGISLEPNASTFLNSRIIILIISVILCIGAVILFINSPNEKAYRNAQKIMASGDDLSALECFQTLGSYRESSSYVDELKLDIFNKGIELYHAHNYSKATDYFIKVSDYQQSWYYLCLIYAKVSKDEKDDFSIVGKIMGSNTIDTSASYLAKQLIKNLDFEDTKDIVLNYYPEYFLEGSWESSDGDYFYTVTNTNGIYDFKFDLDTGKFTYPEWYTSYNIPWFEGENYKYEKGIHYIGSDLKGWKALFKISIKTSDEISLYSFKNNRAYVLRRL